MPRIDRALAEARRVLKRGGRFLCLEFSQVEAPLLARIYEAYSFHAIPRIGEWVTGDARSLPLSRRIDRALSGRREFREQIAAAGFDRADFTRLTGGVVAIHSGWKL